jgi:hypothetical protein
MPGRWDTASRSIRLPVGAGQADADTRAHRTAQGATERGGRRDPPRSSCPRPRSPRRLAATHTVRTSADGARGGTSRCPAGITLLCVVRLEENWSRLAGGSPVRVSAGAPGSGPRLVVERRRVERGVESLFGGSKRVGWDCSLVTVTIGEPSRSCHGEGHVRQSWFRIGCGGSPRGKGTCTCARSGCGTREARLVSLVSEDRSYKPMAKSSGGQRESVGVVVVSIGVKLKALVAKDPCFDRVCARGKR